MDGNPPVDGQPCTKGCGPSARGLGRKSCGDAASLHGDTDRCQRGGGGIGSGAGIAASSCDLRGHQLSALVAVRLPCNGCAATVTTVSTLTEIEIAVDALPQREQQKLLRHLSAKLNSQAAATAPSLRKHWPVPPPKVSKTESQRSAKRIADEFGRVEVENWK